MRARTWLAASGGASLAGALAGMVGAATLAAPLRTAVDRSLSIYVGSLIAGGPAAPAGAVWRAAMHLDLRVAALIWIGGLFAAGWPLTLAVLLAEGFGAGFTLMALAGAAPVSATLVAAVPAGAAVAVLATLGAAALSLAHRHGQARRGRYPPPTGTTYAVYAATLAASLAGLAVVALLQAGVLPAAVRLLAGAGTGLGAL